MNLTVYNHYCIKKLKKIKEKRTHNSGRILFERDNVEFESGFPAYDWSFLPLMNQSDRMPQTLSVSSFACA